MVRRRKESTSMLVLGLVYLGLVPWAWAWHQDAGYLLTISMVLFVGWRLRAAMEKIGL